MKKKTEQQDLEILHIKNHDLKNHLMSIRGYLYIMNNKMQDNPQINAYIEKINSKIDEITKISDEIVEIVKTS